MRLLHVLLLEQLVVIVALLFSNLFVYVQQLNNCHKTSTTKDRSTSTAKQQRRLSSNGVVGPRPRTPQSTTDSESTVGSSRDDRHSSSRSPDSVVDENIDYSSGWFMFVSHCLIDWMV